MSEFFSPGYLGYLEGSAPLLFQLALAILPLMSVLPKRRPFPRNACLAMALPVAAQFVSAPFYSLSLDGAPALKLVAFALTLFACFAAALVACHISPSQALFCCSAGYAIQNFASGVGNLMRFLAQEYAPALLFDNGWYTLPSTLLIYPLYFLLFVRPVRRHRLALVSDRGMVLLAAAVVFAVIGLDVAIKDAIRMGMELQDVLMMRVAHGLVCAFVLYCEYKLLLARQLSTEREVMRRMGVEREQQYRLSRENIDAINIKCHDIRHQIRSLASSGAVVDGAALEDIAREVSIYDSSVETGNPALDTILTEKGLICSREGISFSVIADGAALDFMDPADIYSFFGNALDNAIEATRGLEDPSQRAITLNLRRKREMAVVGIENYCAEEPRFKDDGLPRTSKGDDANHGFGTRSMQLLVERYNGTLTMGYEKPLFFVSACIPLPDAASAAPGTRAGA